MTVKPFQIRAARAALDWSQAKLAEQSGVSITTIKSVESGARRPIPANLAALVGALEAGGIRFTEEGVERRSASPDQGS